MTTRVVPMVVLKKDDNTGKLVFAAASGAGAVALLATGASPVLAQATDPVAQISTMVTNLGALLAVAIVVVLGAMGLRLAVKQINRLMVKG